MFIISYERPDAKATLIKQRSIPMSFFDENLHEVVLENGHRYILKRNPVRAEEIAENRKSKQVKLDAIVAMNLEKPRILPGGKTIADSQKKLPSRRKPKK